MIGHFPLEIAGSGCYYSPTAPAFIFPWGITYDSLRNRIIVTDNINAAFGSQSIKILDGDTLSLITSVTPPEKINTIEYDSLYDRYFIGVEGSTTTKRFYTMDPITYVMTPKLETVFSATVRDISMDYTNDRMYISASTSDSIRSVFVYKLSDLSPITSFPVTDAFSIECDSLNNKLYITNPHANTISIYDLTTYSLLSTIPTGTGDLALIFPYHICQDDINNNLMIINCTSVNKILVYDKSTNTIIKRYSGIYGTTKSVIKNSKIYTTQCNDYVSVAPKVVAILDKFY